MNRGEIPEPTCWKALEPSESRDCFREKGIVGTIDDFVFVPNTPAAVQDKTDGFTLSITVQSRGKQCVDVTSGRSLPPREQVAFVVE